MEGAMAASSGALAGRSCLDIARKKELMCSTSRRVNVCGPSFADRSHLQYYGRLAYCGKKNKLRKQDAKHPCDGFSLGKKRITRLDGLAKDLSALSNSLTQSGAAPPVDNTSLADQVRDRILSDALQVVMTQLAQVKAERKERKRQLKAQKKALKARKDDSAPSSSSESSDSECEVVDVSQLQRSSQPEQAVTEEDPQIESRPGLQAPAILMENAPKSVGGEEGLHLEFGRTACRLGAREDVAGAAGRPSGHIQVCMGPKCRKMGSCQLLSAFEGSVGRNRGLGVEAVGCKCMGKCRNAPNIRVQKHHSHGDDDGSNQLHLGVGVGDVDFIVCHHFGEQVKGNALVPA